MGGNPGHVERIRGVLEVSVKFGSLRAGEMRCYLLEMTKAIWKRSSASCTEAIWKKNGSANEGRPDGFMFSIPLCLICYCINADNNYNCLYTAQCVKHPRACVCVRRYSNFRHNKLQVYACVKAHCSCVVGQLLILTAYKLFIPVPFNTVD